MKKKQRDLRIDFFRGLSLLIIVANHIDLFSGSYFFKFSFKWLHPNFSDAAEIFVFLSGYVYGMVYYKYYQNHGFGQMYFRSFKRFSQLYVLNIVTLFTCLAVYGAFKVFFSLEGAAVGGMAHFFANPASALAFGSMMIYAPSLVNVLPLYMFLLLIMPFYLMGIKNKPYSTLAFSFLLYLLVQFFPAFTLPSYPIDFASAYPWSRGWSFNPFVWQFLFAIGMYLSISFKFKNAKLPKTKTLFYISVAVLLLATIPRFTFVLKKAGILDFDLIGQVPLVGKRNLGPFRLLHFFSLAYLTFYLFPIDHKFFRSKIASPIIRCGQNSLEVFCLGVVMTYSSYYILQLIGLSQIKFWGVLFFSWIMMLFLGYILYWKKNNI